MARISNKEQAIAYAAEHGIILTVEDRVNFDGDYAVEVWSLDSRLSEPNSYCHTYFARGNTEARAWADALAYMQDLAECPADCSCRDQDQEQDQDQDQDHPLPADDTCHTCGTIVPTSYINRDGCDYCQCPICERCELPEPRCECPGEDGASDVWVCECCALMVRNGDESGCRDYYGHTHPTCDKSVVYADMEHTFEVGYFHTNCNGCGELVRTGGTLYAAIRLSRNH